MMNDIVENTRREMVSAINAVPLTERQQMEAEYGRVWDASEMTQEFEVRGFLAPFVTVKRKADGIKGSMMFQHSPRFYFGFRAD